MTLPEATRLELPILQELKATGGSDDLRYLYARLVHYFPQLAMEDINNLTGAGRHRWHRLVQRAGRQLDDKGELRREQARWSITAKGNKRVASEAMQIDPGQAPAKKARQALTHKEAQQILVEIGQWLGRHAEIEFDRYDVVWRESANSPRLSHVFEIQISGSVDSALTRLKHAYDAQRSRPFLVIAGERDARFAQRRLTGSFHEIWNAITVIGVGELAQLYDALKAHGDLLIKLTTKD